MKYLASLLLCFISLSVFSQKLYTKSGKISFESSSPLEAIEAKSDKAVVLINKETSEVKAQVLVKTFDFPNNLMEEHFNENYLHTGKYPKATFIGKMTNPSVINWTKDGTYTVDVKGRMTMHGVSKDQTVKAVMVIKNKVASFGSSFVITTADYGIKIPRIVRNKIAKTAKIKIIGTLAVMK